MKLAEALVLRADLQRRLSQVKQRAQQNVLVQEGQNPPEDPNTLVQEYEREAGRLEGLIRQINRTNLETVLEGDQTLTDALARRDVLRLRFSFFTDLAQQASQLQVRYSRSEIRMVSAVDVADLRRRADDIAREHRELDTAIQAKNWEVDLIED